MKNQEHSACSVLRLGVDDWHVELVRLCVTSVLIICILDMGRRTGSFMHSNVFPPVAAVATGITTTEANTGTIGRSSIGNIGNAFHP